MIILYKIDEWLLFACLWACFDAGKRVQYVLHVNSVKRAFKRRNISSGREIELNLLQNRQMISICVCLGLFRRWRTRALRSARIMHWKSVRTSKYLKRERNIAQFASKSTNDCDLRVCWLVSTLDNAWTTVCTYNAVKKAFKRRKIWNLRDITHNFRQNRPMVAICVCVGLFRRWKTLGLRSAC